MSPRRPRLTRRRLLAGAGVVVVLVAAVAAYAVTHREGNVFNPNVEFGTEPQTPPPQQPPPPSPKKKGKKKTDPLANFAWPFYGYSADRRRVLAAPASLRPPYRRMWRLHQRKLLEFSPVMGGKAIYLLDNGARLWAISKTTGATLWRRKLGVLAASSPAFGGNRVYATVLERRSGTGGRVVALGTKRGHVVWSRSLPSRAESSPLLDGGRIYFGTEDGTVYALRASDGAVRWTFHARGAVKGGLALWNGKLYFGDYAGRAYAIGMRDGHQVWSVGTSGAHFGFSSGQFYATPAVAYARVYMGNTDGNVYSFGARTGQLAWRHRTSAFVYAAAAVGQPRGGRPSVYVGSYDGNFYSLDARNGSVHWSYHDGGVISGAGTLVGNLVYFANVRSRHTVALNARTGRRVWVFGDGAFNPVISDTRTIYLTGAHSLYAFRPRKAGAAGAAGARAHKRRVRHKAAHKQRAHKRKAAHKHRKRQRARHRNGHKARQRSSG
jgi:outer membrane protein assembly factor BamB